MTDLIIYASFTALAIVLMRVIWLSARSLIIIVGTMIVAANADAWIAAALPWRDWIGQYVAWIPLMLVGWAFGVGVAVKTWHLRMWFERRAAHQSVDKRFDEMQ